MTEPVIAALIVAAGRGSRIGGYTAKQYLKVGGRSILARAIDGFVAHPMIERIQIVIHPDDQDLFDTVLAELTPRPAKPIEACGGGASRQESALLGLRALKATLAGDSTCVLVHDAARPFLSEALITRAIAAAWRHGAAIPVLPVVDTVAMLDSAGDLAGNADRGALRLVQTPQAFRFGPLLVAHEAAAQQGRSDFTDDASLVRWRGATVATFAGDPAAFKITTPEDLARAEALAGARLADIRCATGYDVHAFGPGNSIMLGGVKIAHARGVIGHSDADVLLHALTDALLGCIGDGDIGVHFPPSDMRWKGAASRVFLEEAVRRVHARGGSIRHLDGTIVCEAPRIGPHREAIRQTVAAIAGIDCNRVSLKATTSEKLGFTGRGEGIAALATATIALPE
ncbi:MAG TPA: bifunctional 2-C-methyl-D-erythritol 4-phosphate cytidylyltransferase/2-C-methyl-D-erythritol 2,4-cyclodiphosphate synthase [Beijerinckiaceae bacterium]|mgnify:CR=1 FL=1|nr:bifunctional 2-C-methyl-D-erythritol 4-phosphate cytidylyltransferase/2-C-methyl-D-erythritol 2,4-cyclodiphosphate synthase [Beijerinckiaceae bacterium]